MTGTIHTCVLLAKAVRGYLRRLGAAESLGDIGDIAPYAHAVTFDEVVTTDDESLARRPVAASPVEWLASLEADGATDAWVVHGEADRSSLPESRAVAFANGGGAWGVRVTNAARADVWIPRMTHVPLEDPARPVWWRRFLFPGSAARACRPWRVTYTRFPTEGDAAERPRADIEGCSARLRAALVQNRDFAVSWRLKPWDAWFSKALAVLDGAPAGPAERGGLGPTGIFDPAAERLLQAAASAWCFGGMGTWNDIVVKDDDAQQLQESIAGALYDASISAFQQATWPPAEGR